MIHGAATSFSPSFLFIRLYGNDDDCLGPTRGSNSCWSSAAGPSVSQRTIQSLLLHSFLGHHTFPRSLLLLPPPPLPFSLPLSFSLYIASICLWRAAAAGSALLRFTAASGRPSSLYAPPLPLSLPGARKRKIDRPPKRKKEKKDEERGPQRRLPEPSRRRNRSRLLTTLATLSVSLSLFPPAPSLSSCLYSCSVVRYASTWKKNPHVNNRFMA